MHTSHDESGRGWWNAAACAGMGPTLFFPDGEKTDIAAQDLRRAQAVCARCPVRAACLEFALVTHQDYGVWGGTSESERHRLRRACRAADDVGSPRSVHPTGTVLAVPARGQGQVG